MGVGYYTGQARDIGWGGNNFSEAIFRCLLCNKILTKNSAKLIGCKKNNVILNVKGVIIPKHEWWVSKSIRFHL